MADSPSDADEHSDADTPSNDDGPAPDGAGDDPVPRGAGDDAGTDANPAAGAPPPPGAEPVDGGGPSPPADSRWWYWVAALPLYYVLGTVVGFAVSIAAFAFALTGAAAGPMVVEPGIHAPRSAGLGFLLVLAVVVLLAMLGVLLSLLFPVAVYLDADAVAATSGDWDPDPALYGLLGLAGVVAQPLQVPLAVYYLYKRHESEGVP
jgi:hypothetical protein